MDLAARIREARERVGLTQGELAEKVGTTQQNIAKLESGKSQRSGYLGRIAQECGVAYTWLETGLGEMAAVEVAAERHDDISIPVYDFAGSMGPGRALPDHDTVTGFLRLSAQWVRRNLTYTSPDKLAVITAYGDSMEPTFCDGDILIVDRGIADLRIDAVYVLDFAGEVFIKRVQRRPQGGIMLRSDNSLYEPVVIDQSDLDALRVLGRVLWAWAGRRL